MTAVRLELNDDQDRILVTAGYVDKERIKGVPGARWKAATSQWQLPLSVTSATILQAEFGQRLQPSPELVQRLQRLTRLDKASLELSRNPLATAYQPHSTGDERLRPYQLLGSDWLRIRPGGILADEMGAGKTAQVVTALSNAMASGQFNGPVLILAPKSVLWTWEREIGIWDHHKVLTPITASGSAAKRHKAFAAIASGDANVLLINYEALRTHSRIAPYGSIALKRCEACKGSPDIDEKKCEVHPREANEIAWSVVVADEAHRLKDPKAVQTRAAWAVAHQPSVMYRWALTGTPVANRVTDFWSLLHFCDPVGWPGKTVYIDRWVDQVPNPWGGMQVIGLNQHREKEFHALVDPYLLRRTKEMVLPDLPPKVRVSRECVLPPKMRKAYNEMRDDLITELDGGVDLVAFNPMVQVGRLLQLASSNMTLDPAGNFTPIEPSPKLDLLMETLGDFDLDEDPVVVWFASRKLLYLAEARLDKAGISYVSYHGQVDAEDRKIAEQRFQSGRVQVMLLTIGAGKEGLTLTRASTEIYVQRTWSLIEDKQSQDRLHRPGQEADRVLIIDLLTADTIEYKLEERIENKAESLEAIVQDRVSLLELLRD